MKIMTSALTVTLVLGLLAGCDNSSPPPPPMQNPSMNNPANDLPVTSRSSVSAMSQMASDMHVSRNSVDWVGSYTGKPICENCANVEYMLDLKEDNKYTLTYNDPITNDPVKVEGDFKWDATGNSIGMSIDEVNYVYRVGENNLLRQVSDAPLDTKIQAPLKYEKTN